MSKQIVAVVGPTGSGKTALAVTLAKKFNGVLISADSRQVYRGLDIGTNKEGEPGEWHDQPARLVEDVPQLLIDIAQPKERFTLNDWLEQARYALNRVLSAGQLPIVVGGTGLYVTALIEGYQPGKGRGAKLKNPVEFEALILQPEVPRELLNKTSDERFPRIFDALVGETERLLTEGVTAEWLEAIGLDYRYAIRFINSQLTREEAVSQFQQASRQYIRRQLTWWRHHGPLRWVKDEKEAVKEVGRFLDPVESSLRLLRQAVLRAPNVGTRLKAFKRYLERLVEIDAENGFAWPYINEGPHSEAAYRIVGMLLPPTWDYDVDPDLVKDEARLLVVGEIFELASDLETSLPSPKKREEKWQRLVQLIDKL